MLITFLLIHLLAACLAPSLVRRLGAKAFHVLALAPAATAVWAAGQLPAGAGDAHVEHLDWVAALGMDLAFRMDTLAWVMTLIVSAIGALILVYCAHYFDDDDGNLGLLAGALVAFAGAMLGLVTTDDLLVLYIFWEITTVLSYLLVGYLTTSAASTRAAKQALIVTTFGGLAMLIGIVMLGEGAGTYRISELVAEPHTGTTVAWGIALLLVGAITKSALFPFHFWLPGAMAAPTPVSAYLHAAAMVKAGVYLVARFAPGYADLLTWQVVVLVLGGFTMLLGGFRATRQTDLKLLLAYGTVSQLGFLLLLVGYGSEGATLAGLTMLVAHALFKAALFLTTGAIDHAAGTRDIRRLTGVRRRAPLLAVAGTLGAMSMAGIPVLLGFVGKEAALTAVLYPVDGWWSLQGFAAVSVVLGSVLTMAYSARFVWGAFTDASRPPQLPRVEQPRAGESRTGQGSDAGATLAAPAGPTAADAETSWHPPTAILIGVPLLLALASVVLGVTSTALEAALAPHTSSVTAVADGYAVHLGLWHGLGLPLYASILVWVLGTLWWGAQARRPVEVPVPLWPFDAGRTYHHLMRGLDRTALEITGFFQRGSLPALLGIIISVLIALPAYQMVTGDIAWPERVRIADSAAQVAVIVLIILAAVLATRARRRLRAVFLVGVTGYGTAMLYLLHGAPDIALTQILVETVSLVVLVLVLRRLSGRFPDDPSRMTRRVRALLGTAAGVVIGLSALIATSSRIHEPAGMGLPERAVDYGAGYNIVNVILVDVRAWDTMGELSVVLACATGVASLVFLREDIMDRVRAGLRTARGSRARLRTPRGVTSRVSGPSRWLTAGDQLDPQRRSTIFEVVTRLVFHTVLLWSVYLLLSGHNQPGGGFAAGLVGGLALCLRYLAGRGYELRAALPVMPAALLGTGLFIAAGSALVPMAFGSPALRTWDTYLQIPLLGEVHLVTALFFDVGVYLVVLGLMLDILRSLGSGIDNQIRVESEQEQAEGVASR
ncbi:Na+/H+ antiporter subunit A [Ornithinimicrobium pratense]|uniref:Na+/H+ antiporter subunit A n=1 Tax=Ornithinimicrobium pratense TaxID=2593973 RepID=A0A5J6V9W3_9MICO|nr:Na+/H+ antiporter subunit A [Ornithinimicrobium pratense]QFG70011.1 Na+/H+ antiporter subunit A [Ornithinimicrobium pratense]